MKLSPDDPKLTAYALGELDKAEAAAVEQELKNSAELREAVEEIRATAEFLKKEFATEEPIALSPKQRDVIASQIPPTNVVPLPKRNVAIFVSISAIAACVMFVLAWGMRFKPANQNVLTSGNSEFKYAQNAEEAERKKLARQTQPTPPQVKPAVDSKNSPSTKNAKTSAAQLAHDGQLLYEMGKLDEASAKLRESEKLDPENKAAGYYQQLIEDRRLRRQTTEPAERVKIVEVAKAWIEPTKREQLPAADPQASLATSSGGSAFSANTPIEIPAGNRVAQIGAQTGTPPVSRPVLSGPKVTTFSGRSPAVQNLESPAVVAESAAIRRQATMATTATDGTKQYAAKDQWSISASTRGFYDDDVNEYFPAHGKVPVTGKPSRSRHANPSGSFPGPDTARYPRYVENSFESVLNAPLSTVSVDVDTASYANIRRFLNQNQLPPRDAVRIEELVNYFSYDYPQPHDDTPFSVNMEVAGCPWNKQHRLVRVGLKGKEIAQDKRPPSNFVFLIDVSGSMSPSERLPLIKQALRMLVKKMTENDRIAMVVYASSSGVVLDSTSCVNKEKILEAIDRLEAGGSTNGGEGIQRAYRVAEENFIKGGVNRVILATDGDFNVGTTDQSALIDLIQKKAKSGVFLTALGVGTDNYKDALMQKLADKGNGNYFYLDSLEEAQKVLIQQMNGTLVTIAKDVKIQIEFNPAQVQSYRLIGYEKRVMEAQDFNNDKKDAGEIGAGHTVTALYEIVPSGVEEEETRPAVDDLKYQSNPVRKTPKAERRARRSDNSNELLTLKLRYKKPDGDTSKLLEFPLNDNGKKFSSASTDFRFATAVASFGMLLKDSQYRGNFNYDSVREVAEGAKGDDKEGYRAEFINLIKKAQSMDRNVE